VVCAAALQVLDDRLVGGVGVALPHGGDESLVLAAATIGSCSPVVTRLHSGLWRRIVERAGAGMSRWFWIARSMAPLPGMAASRSCSSASSSTEARPSPARSAASRSALEASAAG
jgi:hypothetical protein